MTTWLRPVRGPEGWRGARATLNVTKPERIWKNDAEMPTGLAIARATPGEMGTPSSRGVGDREWEGESDRNRATDAVLGCSTHG